MTQTEINKILVEKGEGGCWHEWDGDPSSYDCKKCGNRMPHKYVNSDVNDFSKWENFGKLLGIAERKHKLQAILLFILRMTQRPEFTVSDINQIPTLISAELAMILKEEK